MVGITGSLASVRDFSFLVAKLSALYPTRRSLPRPVKSQRLFTPGLGLHVKIPCASQHMKWFESFKNFIIVQTVSRVVQGGLKLQAGFAPAPSTSQVLGLKAYVT